VMNIETILVPTDFSDDAKRALETAIELARVFDARVVLLHAFSIDIPLAGAAYGGALALPQDFYTQYRVQATRAVDQLAKETGAKEGVSIQGVAIQQTPWVSIVEQAEKLPADLIVMGTRGLTGLMHIALGSTAERVVRQASCAVLTVKAD
jgi:nucleotide-binding universal stress UspA family protein